MVAAVALPGLAGAQSVRDMTRPMGVVEGFDKSRLVGTWVQLARSVNLLEADCHGVTIDIAAREDSRLTLKLACHKGAVDGPLVPIEGVMAEVIPGLYHLRLVRLPEFGSLEMAVLWAAPDDDLVVIGSRLGQLGWVLARSPGADPAAGVQVLVDNGYVPAAIAPVEQ
ncbi:MAG: lipocalin family protein [Paracoccaceae bacterium]